jgi:hypothetical protein
MPLGNSTPWRRIFDGSATRKRLDRRQSQGKAVLPQGPAFPTFQDGPSQEDWGVGLSAWREVGSEPSRFLLILSRNSEPTVLTGRRRCGPTATQVVDLYTSGIAAATGPTASHRRRRLPRVNASLCCCGNESGQEFGRVTRVGHRNT